MVLIAIDAANKNDGHKVVDNGCQSCEKSQHDKNEGNHPYFYRDSKVNFRRGKKWNFIKDQMSEVIELDNITE